MDCSPAPHARPTSPAYANCCPHQRRRQNLSRPRSRPISSRLVLAAVGACASSRPSNVGCSRGRRHAVPQQPRRRRDPAPFMPSPRRRDAASAIDNPRANGPARVVSAADPCQARRNGQSIAFDIGRDRLGTLSQCASDPAQRTSRPPTLAQPEHQIPISSALHTAGSFLGDFPTPDGVRNSSRQRTGEFRIGRYRKQTFIGEETSETSRPTLTIAICQSDVTSAIWN